MTTALSYCEDERDLALEEIKRLKRALAFWLPGVPEDNSARSNRVASDAALLIGLEGPIEPDAETVGWVALTRKSK